MYEVRSVGRGCLSHFVISHCVMWGKLCLSFLICKWTYKTIYMSQINLSFSLRERTLCLAQYVWRGESPMQSPCTVPGTHQISTLEMAEEPPWRQYDCKSRSVTKRKIWGQVIPVTLGHLPTQAGGSPHSLQVWTARLNPSLKSPTSNGMEIHGPGKGPQLLQVPNLTQEEEGESFLKCAECLGRNKDQSWTVILLLILSQVLCIKNMKTWECCEFLKSLEIHSSSPRINNRAPLIWCANYNKIFHYSETGGYRLLLHV